MTTIAASLAVGMMAADSRCTLSSGAGDELFAVPSTKLIRTKDWIVGCAGDQEDIDDFVLWIRKRRKKRRKVKGDFFALLLSRTALLWISDNSEPEAARDGYFAIGTGAQFALAVMSYQHYAGLPIDPRDAVRIACKHDTNSAEPIDVLRWSK